MSDGVLYKSGATWTASVAKKLGGTVISDTVVQHSNGTTWYKNYPMTALYNQTFNVTWTAVFNWSGVKLDNATWGSHPRSGDSIGFIGLWGFDRTAMQNFVAAGVVQWVKITVMFDDPSHAGNPSVFFHPHVYASNPASFSGANANMSYGTTSVFTQTGADFTRTITLPATVWLGGQMGGIVIKGSANTAANSARFAGNVTSNGMNAYTTTLEIQVLK